MNIDAAWNVVCGERSAVELVHELGVIPSTVDAVVANGERIALEQAEPAEREALETWLRVHRSVIRSDLHAAAVLVENMRAAVARARLEVARIAAEMIDGLHNNPNECDVRRTAVWRSLERAVRNHRHAAQALETLVCRR